MSDEKEMSTSEIEAAITEAWSKYRVSPDVMWYSTSFGTVSISRKGFRVVESFSDAGRELTPEELELFKKEAPKLFE